MSECKSSSTRKIRKCKTDFSWGGGSCMSDAIAIRAFYFRVIYGQFLIQSTAEAGISGPQLNIVEMSTKLLVSFTK